MIAAIVAALGIGASIGYLVGAVMAVRSCPHCDREAVEAARRAAPDLFGKGKP